MKTPPNLTQIGRVRIPVLRRMKRHDGGAGGGGSEQNGFFHDTFFFPVMTSSSSGTFKPLPRGGQIWEGSNKGSSKSWARPLDS